MPRHSGLHPHPGEDQCGIVDVSLLPMLPLGERFSVHGRVGAYFATTGVTTTTPVVGTPGLHGTVFMSGGTASVDDTNVNVTFGAGAAWHASRRVSVRADWQRYNKVGSENVGEFNVDTLSLGVLYRF